MPRRARWQAQAARAPAAAQDLGTSNQIAQERPDVGEPQLPHDDLRRAPAPLVLVAGHLADAEALLERLHQHFLLDRGEIRCEAEFRADVAADGPEAVLAVRQADVPAVIDGEGDQLRADVPNELFD